MGTVPPEPPRKEPVNQPSRPRLLIVCSANAIRSPFVEHLLRARFAAAGAVGPVLTSAGTAARPGRSAEPHAVEIGREHGLDLAPHRTRLLDEAMLRESSTVLCAAAVHRRTVLDMRPDALDTTFTVREFARLLREEHGAFREDGWESLVRRLARGRTRVRRTPGVDDDLVDPIGQPEAVWREFERAATDAVETIAVHAAPALAEAAADRPPMTRREYRARAQRGAGPGASLDGGGALTADGDPG